MMTLKRRKHKDGSNKFDMMRGVEFEGRRIKIEVGTLSKGVAQEDTKFRAEGKFMIRV